MPFESRKHNVTEILNEILIGFLGVVAMTLVGTAITVEDKNTQGNFLCWLLYVKLAFNSLLIVVVTFFSVKECLKKIFRKRRQTQ